MVVPASVRELQRCAFACCDRLKEIKFTDRSRLATIGECCFCDSGLRDFSVGNRVKALEKGTFRNCKQLSGVMFQDESALETIGESCFHGSGLEHIAIPRRVRTI